MRHHILIGWTVMDGMRETGRTVMRDGYARPEFETVAKPRVVTWLRAGTDADVAKAREYAAGEGHAVFTFPPKTKSAEAQVKAMLMTAMGQA